jgi:hypothetical protein
MKLARGANDEERAMSQKINTAIAVIGIDHRRRASLFTHGRVLNSCLI